MLYGMAVILQFPTGCRIPDAAPQKWVCPLGCDLRFEEQWDLDVHMVLVHPGWRDDTEGDASPPKPGN
ncbi:MAG TPA: hypothetical protein VKW78_04590 [Terriglobales bacterium]|nr:hypothetical protein [Terriglobales bacterium]